MEVSLKKFEFSDVPLKVKWINDNNNNKYLHYDLPLEVKKTEEWYLKNQSNDSRFDATIMVDDYPVGIIGLINIDYKKFEAEYYITIGESAYKGKNIATKASRLLLRYAFDEIKLSKVYLTTEVGNIPMQKLARKMSMIKEGQIAKYSMRDGNLYDVFYFSVEEQDFKNNIIYPENILSDIEFIAEDHKSNNIYIKRDDLIPFSFGGNKARKATYFFDEILAGNFNVVVTYGSKVSNHCRIISNLCFKYGIKCIVVSPISDENSNFNRDLINLSGAEVVECRIEEVSDTINNIIENEKQHNNQKVYFIPGGGHGNQGTQAYVDAYNEIKMWSKQNKTNFDLIFLASGTGTTQAGLAIGKMKHQDTEVRVIGVSVARDKSRGSQVIIDSVNEYLTEYNINVRFDSKSIEFYDDYVERTYGKTTDLIDETIKNIYLNYGIPLSSNYTGKAFTGMNSFISENDIANKNILFIHTGGIPLFFDDLSRIRNS